MKTKVEFWIRCYPRVTINKLEKLEGAGTAFITELIRNKKVKFYAAQRVLKDYLIMLN